MKKSSTHIVFGAQDKEYAARVDSFCQLLSRNWSLYAPLINAFVLEGRKFAKTEEGSAWLTKLRETDCLAQWKKEFATLHVAPVPDNTGKTPSEILEELVRK